MAELCFVTTCKGRLAFLRKALPTFAAQPRCECVVVDYSCPEECGSWVESNYPGVKVVRAPNRDRFQPAQARNLAIPAVVAPWICFCDSDVLVAPSFAEMILPRLREGFYCRPDALGAGISGTLICAREDFIKIGGYDELYQGYGEEDYDLYALLNFVGVKPLTFPANLLRHLPHDDASRVRFYEQKDLRTNIWLNRMYRVLKFDVMRLRGQLLPLKVREQLHQSVRQAAEEALARPEARLAKISVVTEGTDPTEGPFRRTLAYQFPRPR